jgi:hypothetical protein
LIPDHHEGYISWVEFERNQRLISDHANGKSFVSRGSVRDFDTSEAAAIPIGRAGDVVARRSLDFYEAVARRLAAESGRP